MSNKEGKWDHCLFYGNPHGLAPRFKALIFFCFVAPVCVQSRRVYRCINRNGIFFSQTDLTVCDVSGAYIGNEKNPFAYIFFILFPLTFSRRVMIFFSICVERRRGKSIRGGLAVSISFSLRKVDSPLFILNIKWLGSGSWAKNKERLGGVPLRVKCLQRSFFTFERRKLRPVLFAAFVLTTNRSLLHGKCALIDARDRDSGLAAGGGEMRSLTRLRQPAGTTTLLTLYLRVAICIPLVYYRIPR